MSGEAKELTEADLRELAERGAAELEGASATDLLRWTDEHFGGVRGPRPSATCNYVVASNMQDAVLVDLAAKVRPGVPVMFLDTGYHFVETIGTRDAIEAVYDVRVLNVTPDHLDRHRTFENYVAAKARVFENQTGSDYTALNADDATCTAMGAQTKAVVCWFSRQHPVERGAFVRGDNIVWTDAGGEQEIMPVSEIGLKGAHNVENVLAGVCAGMLAGVAPAEIRRAVANFKAVEHRLEYVATVRGVAYYNDSKATNVDATIKALESFPGRIHLILGGKDKGSDYSVLNELLAERVKRVYTIGSAAAKIESQIKGAPVVSSVTIDNAVRKAAETATDGDIVLLAPACASFDQFMSYEHRGRVFKDLVKQLESRNLQKAGSVSGGGA